jgi:hypothetical protein
MNCAGRRVAARVLVVLALLGLGSGSVLTQIGNAATPSPSDPGAGYVLDWENPADRSLPARPPTGWGKEYDAGILHDGEPQLRAARAPSEPVRGSQWSARFQLYKGDPVINNGTRAELSADFEPVNAERWYGFSIYLPYTWVSDRSGEIVTQWHQDWNICCSPPLAIVTRNGQWEISQSWQGSEKNTPIGPYGTGRWTDWVVHVKWSANGDGVLDIWKDGSPVSGFFQKQGRNAYASSLGNYMKIGIYKWDWSHDRPSDTTRRVMYFDELRIADQRGSYGAVAPRH